MTRKQLDLIMALRPIKRALLSVSDKSGLADLARALVSHGVELISTGGTRRKRWSKLALPCATSAM